MVTVILLQVSQRDFVLYHNGILFVVMTTIILLLFVRILFFTNFVLGCCCGYFDILAGVIRQFCSLLQHYFVLCHNAILFVAMTTITLLLFVKILFFTKFVLGCCCGYCDILVSVITRFCSLSKHNFVCRNAILFFVVIIVIAIIIVVFFSSQGRPLEGHPAKRPALFVILFVDADAVLVIRRASIQRVPGTRPAVFVTSFVNADVDADPDVDASSGSGAPTVEGHCRGAACRRLFLILLQQ